MKLAFLILVVRALDAQTSATEAQRIAADRQKGQTITAMETSISMQMNAVRAAAKAPVRQTASESFFVFEPELASASRGPSCEPISPVVAQALAATAGRANQVSPDLVFAVMRQESAFVPCAISDKGALGLMQLMPATAAQLGVADPLDAEQNAFAGAKYLKQLFTRYAGDLNRTLGAYNAGPGRVDDYNGVPPFPETLNYVESILSSLQPQAR